MFSAHVCVLMALLGCTGGVCIWETGYYVWVREVQHQARSCVNSQGDLPGTWQSGILGVFLSFGNLAGKDIPCAFHLWT